MRIYPATISYYTNVITSDSRIIQVLATKFTPSNISITISYIFGNVASFGDIYQLI